MVVAISGSEKLYRLARDEDPSKLATAARLGAWMGQFVPTESPQLRPHVIGGMRNRGQGERSNEHIKKLVGEPATSENPRVNDDGRDQASVRADPADTGTTSVASRRPGNWKPAVTLLVLSPAIGELLSGSSPPQQFFNPLFFVLLVGLYGCGALLARETAAQRHLNAGGILLLGAAYGIIEEGLMCKSFFNPYWTDTGFLSVYGRSAGVNWVWTFGLTFYHMVVSITVPIFLTEALFSERAKHPWLRRRGWRIAGTSFGLVVLLGFGVFDNRQFHLIEIKEPLALARRLNAPASPLDRLISGELTAKHREVVHQAIAGKGNFPDLGHALQDELNRLLPRADLYSAERFSGIVLPDDLKQQAARPPRGDKLVVFNRGLLERAYPGILAVRQVYPFRPGWLLTLGSMGVVVVLVMLALTQTRALEGEGLVRRPWLIGLSFTALFVAVGFVLPSLVEHGLKIPAVVDCGIWCGLAVVVWRLLRRMDAAGDRLWRRGLWALGIITPWVFFALLLGLVIRMIGAKAFSGMSIVSLGFGVAILTLGRRWKRRLEPAGNRPV